MRGRCFILLHTSGIGGYLIPSEQLTWVLRDMRALSARAFEGSDEHDSHDTGH